MYSQSITLPKKRPSSDSLDELFQPPSKKKKKNTSMQLAQIFIEGDHSNASTNRVLVSTALFKKLYPHVTFDGTQLIEVAHFVYPIREVSDFGKKKIVVVNKAQERNLARYIRSYNELITVYPFKESIESFPIIKAARFLLSREGCSKSEGKELETLFLSIKSLRKMLKKNFSNYLFQKGQSLYIEGSKGYFSADLIERKYCTDVSKKNVPLYGLLNKETVIDFETEGNLQILKKENSNKIEEFTFTIEKIEILAKRVLNEEEEGIEEAWMDSDLPVPLILEQPLMEKKIRNAFGKERLYIGDEKKIEYGPWQLSVRCSEVFYKERGKNDLFRDSYEKNYTKSYKINKKHDVLIGSRKDVLITTSKKAAGIATRLRFVIIDECNTPDLGINEYDWVFIHELKEGVRKNLDYITEEGCVIAETARGKFLLRLESVTSNGNFEHNLGSDLNQLYEVSEECELSIRRRIGDTLQLVEDLEPLQLTGLTLHAKEFPNIDFPYNKKKKQKKITISESELNQLFLDNAPSVFFDDHQINVVTDEGQSLTFTCENYEAAQSNNNKEKELKNRAYTLTDETKIQWVIDSKSAITLRSEKNRASVENFFEALKSSGLAGLPKECVRFLETVKQFREEYETITESLGLLPTRGVIFAGPPGTGKTSLAREVAKLLGVEDTKVQMISGPQIWDKYVGESERNIRELFYEAREAKKKEGQTGVKESLNIIVIDEIDAFLPKRVPDSNPFKKSVVETFLSELDGISSHGKGSLNNIIVIGLTNHLQDIDEAAIRPGRLGKVIHIGLPDLEGRKEIFEVYTKKLVEKNLLGGNPEKMIEWLAECTVGKTGAFIEGLVSEAMSYPFARLSANKVPANEAYDSPYMELTTEDFAFAYNELMSKQKKGASFNLAPPQEVNYQSIRTGLGNAGLLGVSEEVIEALEDVALTRCSNSAIQQKISYEYPAGLFIHGPSGTGKSSLLKLLRKLYLLSGDRFQYYSTSDLWQKWDENMKMELKELFQPAIQAYKDLAEQSPLYIVAIDDIDRLYKLTKRTKQYESSMMKDLVAEVENAFCEQLQEMTGSKDRSKIKNLLIVATMTTSESWNPNLQKNSAHGIHVRLGYPTLSQRKALFTHFLKPYLENNLLASNVNMEKLTSLTDNKSGEFIKGVIAKAWTYSLRRKEPSNNNNNGESETKLTEEDLLKAIQSAKNHSEAPLNHYT